jgi:Protein of unknown function (DUF3987)
MSAVQSVLPSSVAEDFEIREFPAEARPAPASTGSQASANLPELEPWPVMDNAAYHGLAGDFVRTVGPHTESDPAGLLIQFLVAFGNIVGNSPYYKVEADRHHANLFAAIVGNSSRGRKGTSWGYVREIARAADVLWSDARNASGLSSGEGLIDQVRDEKVEWDKKGQCELIVDPGVADKRLMVIEAEFAGALSAMERHGNNLSPKIRNAWAGSILQTMTKNSPLKATGAHISIIGHITKDELRSRLTRTDIANGFANRFLFGVTKRSKLLAHGGNVDKAAMAKVGERFAVAVKFAKNIGRVKMTNEAASAWEKAYAELSAERAGLLGAVTARAEAQVIRLALIFALADSKDAIDTDHLDAAMAVWAYCDQSAHLIFGDRLGDQVADEILCALRRKPDGMTRTEISNLFDRHRTADQISTALAMLQRIGRAKFATTETKGRPLETWFAVGDAK